MEKVNAINKMTNAENFFVITVSFVFLTKIPLHHLILVSIPINECHKIQKES